MPCVYKKTLLSTILLPPNQQEAINRVLQAGKNGLPVEDLSDLFQSPEVSQKVLSIFGAMYNSDTQRLYTSNKAVQLHELYEESLYGQNNPSSKWGYIDFEHATPTSLALLRFITFKALITCHWEESCNVIRS